MEMKKLLMVFVILGLFLLAANANASCQCVFMNGEVRSFWSSTLDIEPVSMTFPATKRAKC